MANIEHVPGSFRYKWSIDSALEMGHHIRQMSHLMTHGGTSWWYSQGQTVLRKGTDLATSATRFLDCASSSFVDIALSRLL